MHYCNSYLHIILSVCVCVELCCVTCCVRKGSKRVRELWWLGLPPGIRGEVWKRAIGNDLNISPGEEPLCKHK